MSNDDFFPDEAPTTPPRPATSRARGGGDVERFDVAPIPAGLIRSVCTEAKKNPKSPKKLILNFQPDEGAFAGGEPVAIFLEPSKQADAQRIIAIAGVLGAHAELVNGTLEMTLSTFKGKSCRAMYVPWHKDDGTTQAQIGKFVPPEKPDDKNHSPEFHAWMTEHGVTYESIKGCTGILPLT